MTTLSHLYTFKLINEKRNESEGFANSTQKVQLHFEGKQNKIKKVLVRGGGGEHGKHWIVT